MQVQWLVVFYLLSADNHIRFFSTLFKILFLVFLCDLLIVQFTAPRRKAVQPTKFVDFAVFLVISLLTLLLLYTQHHFDCYAY